MKRFTTGRAELSLILFVLVILVPGMSAGTEITLRGEPTQINKLVCGSAQSMPFPNENPSELHDDSHLPGAARFNYILDLEVRNLTGNTLALLIYAADIDILLYAIVDPSMPEYAVDQIISESPEVMIIEKLNPQLTLINDLTLPFFSNGLRISRYFRGPVIIAEETLAEVWFESACQFDVALVHEDTNIPGCIAQGHCQDHPIEGHVCRPCIFIVCCHGSIGYLQCGGRLCH